MERNDTIQPVTCPFTGETLAAVPALHPDVTIIHAQQADERGNVLMWGITGINKEAVLAAHRVLVTVEEIVDELEPVTGSVVLPSWVLNSVAVAPGGTYPSYTAGYSDRDNNAYERWDGISRHRETFLAWIAENVIGRAEVR
jgi:glutaconate CoA-transferase subunit A